MYCNNEDEHKKEGKEDFERHGRYGMDHYKYDNHFNDCDMAYTKGFGEAMREEDRRREQYEEERREEERRERQAMERRKEQQEAEEEAYNQVFYQPEPEPPYYEPDSELPF